MKKLIALAVCAAMLLCAAVSVCAETTAVETARPSANGRLHTEGTQLTDAAGPNRAESHRPYCDKNQDNYPQNTEYLKWSDFFV